MGQIIQRHKKLFAGIFLFIVMFSFFGSCCKCAINKDYGDNAYSYVADLDKKVEQSTLWEAIAQLIYGVGNIIENLISVAMEKLTGNKVYPWADRIIFNTIPFLDINFLNPDEHSMFGKGSDGNDQILAKIVKNVYYTVLSLAVGFLGVAVGIMAVRLAISSIAAEKAKYKEAIMNWLLGIVMLFTMHFILSFVFYTNEQMVKIASNILNDSLKDITIDPINNEADYFEIADNFLGQQLNDVSRQGPDWGTPSDKSPGGNPSQGVGDAGKVFDKLKTLVNQSKRNKVMFGRMVSDSTYRSIQLFYAVGGDEYSMKGWDDFFNAATGNGAKGKGAIRTAYNDFTTLLSNIPDDNYIDTNWSNEKDKANEIKKVARVLRNIEKSTAEDGTVTNSGTAKQLIADMGTFFNESAWSRDSGAWHKNSISITGATLYAIFVIQSLIYFIQYIKRFFYVIILSLMGPIVVIYDFVTKSIR